MFVNVIFVTPLNLAVFLPFVGATSYIYSYITLLNIAQGVYVLSHSDAIFQTSPAYCCSAVIVNVVDCCWFTPVDGGVSSRSQSRLSDAAGTLSPVSPLGPLNTVSELVLSVSAGAR